MLFYVLLFISCSVLVFINDRLVVKDKKKIEIITIIFLAIISGTRYYLGGTDYGIYNALFDGLPNITKFINGISSIRQDYMTFGHEMGYLIYNSIIKSLGFNFFGFTLINSCFFYFCLYRGLKKYITNFNLMIVIFLYKLFFYNTFISMRQSIAIGIFFLSLEFIENKQPIKYFICCFMAFLFHNSAIILFAVYFINIININKKRLIILNMIFIGTLILSYLNINIMNIFGFIASKIPSAIFQVKFQNIIRTGGVSRISLLHTLEYFSIMAILIFNYNKIVNCDNHSSFVIKIFLILLPVFTLFSGFEILTRIKDYFIFSYAIILWYLCKIKNKRYRTIVELATIAICAFGFFRFIMLFDNGGMIPYESYLFKGMSIFR